MEILLSVITICYNDVENLEKTIRSLLDQTVWKPSIKNENIEYIIIDGASTDGTLEMLERYREQLKERLELVVVSEADAGIFNAMNKGLDRARGKWLHFLNAGDVLLERDTYEKIWRHFTGEDCDVLYGNYIEKSKWYEGIVDIADLEYMTSRMIMCHQATFVRKDVHLRYRFDESYKYTADYKVLLQMYLDRRRFCKIPLSLVVYDLDGVSARNMCQGYKELYRVQRELGVERSDFSGRMIYWYGLIRLSLISRLPQGFRWKLVQFKRKIIKRKAIY